MSQGWGQPPNQGSPVQPGGYGGPPGGYGAPPGFAGPPGPSTSPSGMAIAAIVLGIGAWIAGGILFSIPGAIVAKMELNNIERGQSPEAGRTLAQIGWWASLINIIISVLALAAVCVLWVVVFGFAAGSQSGY